MKNVYTLLALMLVMAVSAVAQPIVGNAWATVLDPVTVDIEMQVDDNGEDTEVEFSYGTVMGGPYDFTVEVFGSPDVIAGTGITLTEVTTSVGLTPGMTYYLVGVASNASGTVTSIESSFTMPPFMPFAAGLSVPTMTSLSATLEAMIDDGGAETMVVFSWGTDMGGPYTNSSEIITVPAFSNLMTVNTEITNLMPGTDYYFIVTSTNSAGIDVSMEMSFTSTEEAVNTIISQPEDITDCGGTPGHLLTVVGGSSNGTAQFQWMRDGVDLIEGADFAMSTTSSGLVLGELKYEDAGVYTCDIWSDNLDRSYAVTTEPVVLNVIQTPVITRQPTSPMAAEGDVAEFTIEANIFGKDETDYPVDIQWFLNEVAIEDGGRYSGAKTNHLIVSDVTASDYTAEYKVAMGGMCGSVESNNVSVSKFPGVQINLFDAAMDDDCEGSVVTITVEASATNNGNDADLVYTWMVDNVVDASAMTSSYSHTLTTTDVLIECTVTNSFSGLSQTQGQNFLGLVNTAIIREPVSLDLAEGEELALIVEAVGENLTYLWSMMSGTMSATLSNNTSAVYLVASGDGGAQASDAGVYTCIVTGDCGEPVVSASATVTVAPPAFSSISIRNENVFNLYNAPNPSYDGSTEIRFELGNSSSIAILSIVDSFGNTVLTTNVSGGSYSLSGLDSGSYFYILTAGENSVTKKMIIIK